MNTYMTFEFELVKEFDFCILVVNLLSCWQADNGPGGQPRVEFIANWQRTTSDASNNSIL